MTGEKFFEIAASYPELPLHYGLVVGLLYNLPYSVFGLLMGGLTDRFNRKLMLGIFMIIASVAQLATGLIDSFPVLCGMRFIQGALNSATKPLSYSLVSDYVPQEYRSTANSILNSGVYIGIALSSMSILSI